MSVRAQQCAPPVNPSTRTSGSPSASRSTTWSGPVRRPLGCRMQSELPQSSVKSRDGPDATTPARAIVRVGRRTPNSPADQASVACTPPLAAVTEPAGSAAAGAAGARAAAVAAARPRSARLGRRDAGTGPGRIVRRRGGGGLVGLGLGRLGALAGPRLVELDAPLAVLGLQQRQTGAEGPAAAPLEAGDGLLRAPAGDELAGDGGGQLLAGLALPDDEAAAGVLARPAREALAVLDDVVAADRARPEVRARDAHVLELGVELPDRRAGELGDVAHEPLARLVAVLDLGQAALPVAGQRRRGERVPAEQPDHVHALLGGHQGPRVALDVADVDEALDDRRPRGRRADPGLLHRLAHLV